MSTPENALAHLPLNPEPLLEVHENRPGTWNIIIPSKEVLEMEATNPWVAGSESLSDELMNQVSAGEAITLSVVGVLAGSFVIGKISIALVRAWSISFSREEAVNHALGVQLRYRHPRFLETFCKETPSGGKGVFLLPSVDLRLAAIF